MLDEQSAHVVDLRGFDADRSQHALERQFDQFLGLAHDIGMAASVAKHREGLESDPRRGQVAAG